MSTMEFDTVLEVRRTQLEYDKLKAQLEHNIEQRYHWGAGSDGSGSAR